MAQIKSRVVSGVTVFDLSGKILLGEGDRQLLAAVRDALDNGVKKIVLNLAEVTYIDSAGLGAFSGCKYTVKQEGGKLKLHSIQHKIHDLLVITRLLTDYETYETEKEAIASFK